jgi:hypothetical protein
VRNTGKRVNVRSPIRQTLDTEMTAKASSRAGELILLGERLKGGGAIVGAIVAAFEKARPPPLPPQGPHSMINADRRSGCVAFCLTHHNFCTLHQSPPRTP